MVSYKALNTVTVRFEENAKYGFLGNLFYEDYVFGVYLFEDSVGQYICLEYIVNNVSDIEDTLKYIEERVIAGKYIVKGTDIILQTFFPVLFEETFFERQVNNSMSVLQRMIHICRH